MDYVLFVFPALPQLLLFTLVSTILFAALELCIRSFITTFYIVYPRPYLEKRHNKKYYFSSKKASFSLIWVFSNKKTPF